MAKGDAARIRQKLGHPILDGDGHWIEAVPVLLDYIRDAGGAEMAERYFGSQAGGGWYGATWEERKRRRLRRGNWWITTADTEDFASGMLPGLLANRMDDLGLDFAIIYPTRCLGANSIQQDEMRQVVCRAYNNMVADVFRPYSRRLTPAALIPCYTPDEAIAEVEHAINDLGLKACSFKGSLTRPIPAYAKDEGSTNGVPYYVDALGLDNPHDYDKLWQRCVDLGVAVTVHQASGWVDRMSYSNGEFNRVGHPAQAHDPLTKALFLGGVARRFPRLTFSFLEGGVGYAVMLLSGLLGGFEKRRYAAMEQHLRPSNIDTQRLRQLIDRYGYASLKAKADDAMQALQLDELTRRETEALDDYAMLEVETKQELTELFARNFYFGCEADDPTTAWAFDPRMPGRLKAMLGTDISHWDVTGFEEVVPEVWEMVEHGLITESDLRDFTFVNPVRLHGQMNPNFFKGTAVEEAATAEMVSNGLLPASAESH